ncbi:MAG: thiol:disulfide interchange protein DsbA/DsbL [Betaproteobacteria bacterium]|nr:MAG: thiol:disulfide interchange protein DsbA/DsbL [Betaproteobacteria bacterium]
MDMTRRNTLVALALAALGGAGLAQAQQPGTHYTVLKPELPVNAPGKIEVIEFFWYGCIHCYNLEAELEKWQRKLAPDVQFRRVPAIFNARWGHDAGIYFALEAMGVIDKLHRPLFDAIHVDRLRTDDAKALSAWLQKQGVDAKRFDEVFKSFGVQSKVRQAQQLTVAYRIDGTPAMAVHGRYTVSPEQGGSQRGVLSVVDYLVELTRKGAPARK